MSRIRGIDAKVQNEVLQSRRNWCNETNNNTHKKKSEDPSTCPKDEAEKQQIAELLSKLPKLQLLFEVHRKIGEGTFSSVYLGSLRAHGSLAPAQRRWFALKHLVPTAHPVRIEHELRCLRDIGGKNNVIGVDLCLRHLDTIVFVMPYIPHKKFSEYVGLMSAEEVREYMRALLVALRHVHSFGVIHRDVKPSNFLYDRESRRYLLVDFGLAQRVVRSPSPPPCAHARLANKRARGEDEAGPDAKRMALDLSVKKSVDAAPPAPPPPPSSDPPLRAKTGAGVGARCACASVGGVCVACSALPPPRAPRAGTQGFRPPEVLLKVVVQTTRVDVWAAGVVLASLLTARYPFFRASDDAAALAELTDLLGTQPLARAARALDRKLVTSVSRRGLCMRKLCARLRGAPPPTGGGGQGEGGRCAHCRLACGECLCVDDSKPPTAFTPGVTVAGFPDAAYALLGALLEPDPRRRPSAAHALDHPYFTERRESSARSIQRGLRCGA